MTFVNPEFFTQYQASLFSDIHHKYMKPSNSPRQRQNPGGCEFPLSWPCGSSQIILLAGPYKVNVLYNPVSVRQRLSLSRRLMLPGLIEHFRYQQKLSAKETACLRLKNHQTIHVFIAAILSC